jgi:hypothetical protein
MKPWSTRCSYTSPGIAGVFYDPTMNRKVLLVQVDAAAVLSLGLWRLKLLIALLEEKNPGLAL